MTNEGIRDTGQFRNGRVATRSYDVMTEGMRDALDVLLTAVESTTREESKFPRGSGDEGTREESLELG